MIAIPKISNIHFPKIIFITIQYIRSFYVFNLVQKFNKYYMLLKKKHNYCAVYILNRETIEKFLSKRKIRSHEKINK